MTTQRVVVPELIAETNRMIAELQADLPDWTADASSPIRYAVAQRVANKIIEYMTLNGSYDALLFSRAKGDDQDLLMEWIGLERRAGESDDDYRARGRNQFNALDKDNNDWAPLQARTVLGVSDAAIIKRGNDNVDVYIQGPNYTDSNPPSGTPPVRPTTDSTLQAAVQEFLTNGVVNGVSISPWFAQYDVKNETRTPYTIAGTITYQAPATEATIAAAITAQELTERRLGRTVSVSRFIAAALSVDGVHDPRLTLTPTPAAGSNDTVYVGTIGTITYTLGTII